MRRVRYRSRKAVNVKIESFPNRVIALSLPTFDELEASLRRAGVLLDAAEAHGVMSAILCTGKSALREDWLDRTFAEGEPNNANALECRRFLERTWNDTWEALKGTGLEFEPILPHDDADLQMRVDALTEWCSGFMFGIGISGLESLDELPPDVQEILKDMSEIGGRTLDLGDDEEADESAYMELAEYLKVGVQLVHDELNPARPQQFRAPPGVH